MLDNAIFKRVVRDNANPASWISPGNCRAKSAFQNLKLVVYFNTKRLERLSGRMSAVTTRCCGNCCLDYLNKLKRRLNGTLFSRLYNASCNA